MINWPQNIGLSHVDSIATVAPIPRGVNVAKTGVSLAVPKYYLFFLSRAHKSDFLGGPND